MTAAAIENSKFGDVILSRKCWIEAPGGEVSPLTLSFLRPQRVGDDEIQATLWIDCKHFIKEESLRGSDELEVFARLLHIGLIDLQNLEGDGYSIWHHKKGDLQYFDFWTGSQHPRAFCLPSAYTEARRDAFHKANAGRFLMPSHRVGVEPDRPAVTIYRVNKDGGDSLGSVIGPEELQGQTWESLAQSVGDRILWDSREGIELMIALQPDRKADDESE